MGFTDKIPDYQAFMKILEAISPKNKDKIPDKSEIADLFSPMESPIRDQTDDIYRQKMRRIRDYGERKS